MSKKLTIYTDGGARGNPGRAGIGVVILDDKANVMREFSQFIGEATNNQAEYRALLKGLGEAIKMGAENIEIMMDSELVVKQLKLEYKVKDKNLAILFLKAWKILQKFKSCHIRHIRREQNKKADKLVNQALDKN